ncbi:hypothetical protein ACFE04_024262 [Oxalis oulophora]
MTLFLPLKFQPPLYLFQHTTTRSHPTITAIILTPHSQDAHSQSPPQGYLYKKMERRHQLTGEGNRDPTTASTTTKTVTTRECTTKRYCLDVFKPTTLIS